MTNARRSVVSFAVLLMTGCASHAPVASVTPDSNKVLSMVGAWKLIETASRPSGSPNDWDVRPVPQGGLFVFSERHYSYFYVPGPNTRPLFVDANRPTDAERAATFSTFIAGAGTYTFDGRGLALRSDFRKNPNEMNGDVWNFELDMVRGDTLRAIFREPPFLPGRVWRITIARAH